MDRRLLAFSNVYLPTFEYELRYQIQLHSVALEPGKKATADAFRHLAPSVTPAKVSCGPV